jgi:hypothetical protein
MRMTAEQVFEEAMELSVPLRAFVAEKLIESLDLADSSELSPEWRKELQRRCREMDEETCEFIDADLALARAHAALA